VRDLCYGTLLWERFGAIFPWPLHVFAALVLKTNKKKCMKNKQTNNINTEKRRGSRKKQTHESFQSVNLWEERARYSTPTHTHMDAKKATWLLFWKLFSWIPDTESHIRGRETIQQRFCQQRAGLRERERERERAVTAKELLKSSEAMQQQHQRRKETARDSPCHLTMTSCHVEGSITRVLTVDSLATNQQPNNPPIHQTHHPRWKKVFHAYSTVFSRCCFVKY